MAMSEVQAQRLSQEFTKSYKGKDYKNARLEIKKQLRIYGENVSVNETDGGLLGDGGLFSNNSAHTVIQVTIKPSHFAFQDVINVTVRVNKIF